MSSDFSKVGGEIFRPAPCCRLSERNAEVAGLGNVFRNERSGDHPLRNAVQVNLIVTAIPERFGVSFPVAQGEQNFVGCSVEVLHIIGVVCRDDLRDGALHTLEPFGAFLVVLDKFALFEDLRENFAFELRSAHRSVDEEACLFLHLFDLLEIILHDLSGLSDTLRGTLGVLDFDRELGSFLAQVAHHAVETDKSLADDLVLHARRAVEAVAEEDERVEHIARNVEVIASQDEEALRAVLHILCFEGCASDFIACIAAVHYRTRNIKRFGVRYRVVLIAHNTEHRLRVGVLGDGKEVLHFRAVGEVDGGFHTRVIKSRLAESFVEGVAICEVLPDAVEHRKAFQDFGAPFGGGVEVAGCFGVLDNVDGFAHCFYLLVVGVVGFDVAVAVNGQGDGFAHSIVSFGGLPHLFLGCTPA